jgi:hypothetical protein
MPAKIQFKLVVGFELKQGWRVSCCPDIFLDKKDHAFDAKVDQCWHVVVASCWPLVASFPISA